MVALPALKASLDKLGPPTTDASGGLRATGDYVDMGEPVNVVDLARDMIRLSRLEVGHDVEITFTGTRPGEKLFDEQTMFHQQWQTY